ncbi:Gar1/Naf1 RNA binding region-domain-containing protein [Apiospora arundinis]|uniref:H/ACA ribonucleoprotein complex non-core subunit NAF1 n=1 Tax=Apiospora arundinis TaxID=335852 RepID=A0ABR2IU19_9PEZI
MGSQFFQIPGLSTLSPPAQQAQQTPAPAEPQDQAMTAPSTTESHEQKPLSGDHDLKKDQAGQDEAPAAMEVDSAETPTQKDDSAAMAAEAPPSPPSLLQSLEAQLGSFTAPAPAETSKSVEPHAPVAEQNSVMTGQGDEVQAPAGEVATQEEGGQPEWEEDSSPYESSSDSSDSSDSDDDSDDDGEPLLNPEAMARILMEADSDDEGEGRKGAAAGGQLRTKNEIPEEVIPKPDVTITPETKVEELGHIEHIVDNVIVVKSSATGEYRALETGSVLCNEARVVIAAMDNIIGSVREPRYTARFTNAEEITSYGLTVGSKVFFCPEHSTFVDTGPLKAMKGTDASNWHDEEVAEDEMEFSDDEKEQAYKRELKEKKRARNPNKGKGGDGPPGKRGGRGGYHDGGSHAAADPGSLKYDDEEDEDGPYRPLARPAGFGTGAAPSAGAPFTHGSGGSHRGGGRGDHRGRGRGRPDRGGRGGRGYHRGGESGHSLPSRSYGQEPQSAPQQPQFPNFGVPPPPQFPQGSYSPSLPQFYGGAGGQQAAAPAPFPFPAWPQNMAQNFVPPPPPQFQQQQQQQQQQQPQTQNAPNPAFYNPAFLAALQQLQGQGAPQNGQWPPQQGGSS